MVAIAVLLSGCAATQDAYARAAAREAVAQVVETRFPGVPVVPVTDCVIDNASGTEIVRVASDAADGRPGAETFEVVADVVSRPRTIECLSYEALPVLLT